MTDWKLLLPLFKCSYHQVFTSIPPYKRYKNNKQIEFMNIQKNTALTLHLPHWVDITYITLNSLFLNHKLLKYKHKSLVWYWQCAIGWKEEMSNFCDCSELVRKAFCFNTKIVSGPSRLHIHSWEAPWKYRSEQAQHQIKMTNLLSLTPKSAIQKIYKDSGFLPEKMSKSCCYGLLFPSLSWLILSEGNVCSKYHANPVHI